MHLALARVNHHRLVEHGQDGSRWRDALDGPGRTPARGLGARVRHGESERANQEGAHGQVSALIHPTPEIQVLEQTSGVRIVTAIERK